MNGNFFGGGSGCDCMLWILSLLCCCGGCGGGCNDGCGCGGGAYGFCPWLVILCCCCGCGGGGGCK